MQEALEQIVKFLESYSHGELVTLTISNRGRVKLDVESVWSAHMDMVHFTQLIEEFESEQNATAVHGC